MERGEWRRARDRLQPVLAAVLVQGPQSPLAGRVLTDAGIADLHLGDAPMGAQLLTVALARDPRCAPAREALDAWRAGRAPPPFRRESGAAALTPPSPGAASPPP